VIDLSRNFGHHKAMMTGLMHARGDLVFLVDTDLEEEPELLEHFLPRVRSKGS
jgi:putative glycosyltransferase